MALLVAVALVPTVAVAVVPGPVVEATRSAVDAAWAARVLDAARGMVPVETTPLSDLVTRIRVTHHVTTRLLLHEMDRAIARLASRTVAQEGLLSELRRAFTYFHDDLLAHLLAEERTVFPHVVGLELAVLGLAPPPHAVFHSMASPIQLMKNEQANVERMLDRLEAGVAAVKPPGGIDPSWTALDALLQRLRADLTLHVQVEQMELFPAALELEQRLFAQRMAKVSGPRSGR